MVSGANRDLEDNLEYAAGKRGSVHAYTVQNGAELI